MEPDHAAAILAAARAAAETELHRARAGSTGSVDDQSDASSDADDLVAAETGEAVEELLTRRLEAITRAEERLRDGTYGLSVRSGEPIPDARLEIEPWAELTVDERALS